MSKNKQYYIDRALDYFNQGYACSQAVLLAYAPKYSLDETAAKLIASTFGGGMGRLREKCGAITGGFMVLGLEYGNTNPTDMDTKLNSYRKVRELNKKMLAKHETTMCGELLQKYVSKEEVAERKHHKIICTTMVADVAAEVWELIQSENK
ncbi:MAG TPA: C-GCAxxG-C-C family protein [Bacteroidales bacterium]|nr:C-GCAxxG-C-C family protein [Bacteroidales bacterium]